VPALHLDLATLRRNRAANLVQSALLLGGMALLLGLAGWIVAGTAGLVAMLVGGIAAMAFAPKAVPALVLRLYGARRLDRSAAPELHDLCGLLAGRAGLPSPPRLYYLPSRIINAFTVGDRGDAAITLSHGLLATLEMRELAAVLAHEVAHLANRDTSIMAIADLATRLTATMGQVGVVMALFNLPLALFGASAVPWTLVLVLVLAPSVSSLMQLALSRNREFAADATAVRLTGDPDGLAAALARIERVQGAWWERLLLPGRRVPDPSLLRTHPPTAERIARLRSFRVPRREGSWPPFAGSGRVAHGPGPARDPRWRISGVWY
jgi:heat shock protein HtpX